MPPDKLEGIVHIIEEAEAISPSSETNDNVKEEDDTQQESLEPIVDEVFPCCQSSSFGWQLYSYCYGYWVD